MLLHSSLLELLEHLAEALILAEPSDTQAFEDLKSIFQHIAGWGENLGREDIIAAAQEAQTILTPPPNREKPLSDSALENLNLIVGLLQGLKEDMNVSPVSAIKEPEISKAAASSQSDAAPPLNTEAALASLSLADDQSLLQDFLNETQDHLERIEKHLLVLESTPASQDDLHAVFRGFHTIKGAAAFMEQNAISSLAHEAENLLAQIRQEKIALKSVILDALFETVDVLKTHLIEKREKAAGGDARALTWGLIEMKSRLQAAVSGGLDELDISARTSSEVKITPPEDKTPAASNVVSKENPKTVFSEAREVPETPPLENETSSRELEVRAENNQKAATVNRNAAAVKEIIKIDAERLDRLLDAIGELVIAESMVSQSQVFRAGISPVDAGRLNQLDKITRELQQMATSLRMIPLRSIFQKMTRLVRDLSKKAHKPIEFVISGEDTELDKTMVDGLMDPLVHLLRNAVDHGLEPNTSARQQSGKPAVGRIEIRAFHKSGSVFLEVEDDGRGLNREAILAQARTRGLNGANDGLTEREVFNLIFEPGFSTAPKVTEVSGRGVGLDVVKKTVEKMRGQVEVASTPGKGSTFSLKLPLTLAIIDGMVVRAGSERYIIPKLAILRSIKPERKQITDVMERGAMLAVNGHYLPLFRLSRLFSAEDTKAPDLTRMLVVVVEGGAQQLGLVVDELLGHQQIVIKNLGNYLHDLPGISGGAIMPDGSVGLIIDIEGLIRLAQEQPKDSSAQAYRADNSGCGRNEQLYQIQTPMAGQ